MAPTKQVAISMMSRELTQDEIFARFTDEQKTYIKSKLTNRFDVSGLQSLIGSDWSVECYGVCLYITKCHQQNGKSYDLLFEAVMIDLDIHVRCSVNEKTVDSHSALSVNRELEALEFEECAVSDFIKVFSLLEHCFNEPEQKLFNIRWHD